MVLNIVTADGFDFGQATSLDDRIVMAQLPASELNQLQSSSFPDAIVLGGGNDYFENDSTGRITFGNAGNDRIIGGAGNDTIAGGRNDDIIEANAGDNIFFGNLNNDVITGGSGSDTIFSGQGNDEVNGGAGNDILSGDRGLDTLTGGGGADQFVLPSSGANRDVITDFQLGVDKIVLPDGVAVTDVQGQNSGGNAEVFLNGEIVAILNGVAIPLTTGDVVGGSGGDSNSNVGDPPAPPGSTLADATDLGVLTEAGFSLRDFVGDSDFNDYYRFTVPSNGRFSTTLGSVTETARLQLIKDLNQNGEINEGDGDFLASDLAYSYENGGIFQDIEAGTYYVRVAPYYSNDNTNYDLTFEFSPQPSTTPADPGNNMRNALDLGVISPGQTRSFTEFVGETDSNDFYRFTITSNSDLNFRLGSVRNSARIQIIDDFNNNFIINEGDGDILTSDLAYSDDNASITRALPSGAYYVRVIPYYSYGNTNYSVSIAVE